MAKQTKTTKSQAARAHIAEGTRLVALAGRPTKAQFIKVYGPQGPKMTWAQRAKAGVDAKHLQTHSGRSPRMRGTAKARGRRSAKRVRALSI